MNWNVITAIARKDLKEVSQNRGTWMPMVIVPLLFTIVFPLAFLLLPVLVKLPPEAMEMDRDLAMMIEKMPPAMAQALSGNANQDMMIIVLGYIFAPLFLIFPLMFSTIIASESFAGERERKTMEALLYTPAGEVDLFLGKVLAGFIPAVGVSWVSFSLYTLVLNLGGYPLFGRVWFPLPSWYPLIFWITPALALMGISAAVLISSRVQTFMGAYQTSASLVILPMGLMIGQVTGALYLSVGVGLLVGLVFWLVAGGLTWAAIRLFNRSKLLGG